MSGHPSRRRVLALTAWTIALVAGCQAPPSARPTDQPSPAPVATLVSAPAPESTPAPTRAQPPPPRPTPTLISQAIATSIAAGTPTTAEPGTRVGNTGGQGLTLRRAPGGDPIAVLPDGTTVTPTGAERQVDNQSWVEVTDSSGRVGWVAAGFIVTGRSGEQPARGLPTTEPTLAPVATVAVIPTATHGELPPRPTRTPLPSPEPPVSRPTQPPLIVPSIGAPAAPTPVPTPSVTPRPTITPARR